MVGEIDQYPWTEFQDQSIVGENMFFFFCASVNKLMQLCARDNFPGAVWMPNVRQLVQFKPGSRFGKGGFNSVFNLLIPREEKISDEISILDPSKYFHNPKALIRIGEFSHLRADEMQTEINLQWKMSKLGLGPKVFGMYWDCFLDDKYQDPDPAFHLAIVMERFDMNLWEYFVEHDWSKNAAQVATMLNKLLRSLAQQNVLCLDVKPPNVMVRLRPGTDEIVSMRLIDFGGDFCFERKQNIELNYTLMLLIFQAITQKTFPKEAQNGFLKPYLKLALANLDIRKRIIHLSKDWMRFEEVWDNYLRGTGWTVEKFIELTMASSPILQPQRKERRKLTPQSSLTYDKVEKMMDHQLFKEDPSLEDSSDELDEQTKRNNSLREDLREDIWYTMDKRFGSPFEEHELYEPLSGKSNEALKTYLNKLQAAFPSSSETESDEDRIRQLRRVQPSLRESRRARQSRRLSRQIAGRQIRRSLAFADARASYRTPLVSETAGT